MQLELEWNEIFKVIIAGRAQSICIQVVWIETAKQMKDANRERIQREHALTLLVARNVLTQVENIVAEILFPCL